MTCYVINTDTENGDKRKPIKFKDDDHRTIKTIVSARRMKMEDAANEMAQLFKKKNQRFIPAYAN